MAARLRALGFVVFDGYDLGKRDLERRIGEFSDALRGAKTGMLFYAGHGIQVDGRNFMIPVDARLDQPAKLRLEAVGIDDVIDIIEQQAEASIVFLDACRNNPFTRSSGLSSRGAEPLSGLAQFAATRGSFIAFSTAPGKVALDGTGRNSPFTAALLRHIDTPGQSINDLMIAVRRDVIAETGDGQRPWEQGSLTERFEFVPDGKAPAEVAAATVEPVTQGASAQRSVAGVGGVEDFIRDVYLASRPGAVDSAVARVYDRQASILGTRYALADIIALKTQWFAQWSAWTLSLEPGSLATSEAGPDRTVARFDLSYDYVPAAAGAARMTGRARVTLELARREDGWRVTSETTEAVP